MSKKHKHISAVKTTEQKAVQQSQQPQELTPQKLNRLLEKNPFAQLLGMELLEVREGYAYGRMRMDEHFTNIYGGMHGGCAYALADTLAGLAASTYGNYVTTIDGKMNYLEAVKDTGYVYGEAEVQRQGGRIGVYTVKLMDENQRVLVTADFTYYRTAFQIHLEFPGGQRLDKGQRRRAHGVRSWRWARPHGSQSSMRRCPARWRPGCPPAALPYAPGSCGSTARLTMPAAVPRQPAWTGADHPAHRVVQQNGDAVGGEDGQGSRRECR